MSNFKELILSPENLSWAWRKARRQFASSDIVVDAAEVAGFELDLERQLRLIAKQFENLTYRLKPLRHIPQPKKPKSSGESRLRQSFHLAVRDQVAWLAVVNAIGPILDAKMQPWSYGSRLYKAAWYEELEGVSHLELGPYRHSTGHLYRKFKHSWPLFRRHISMTARFMATAQSSEIEFDDAERSALSFEARPPYLDRFYWPEASTSEIYYASLDLSKFYPRVQQLAIKRALIQYLDGYNEDPWLQGLINRLLAFRVGADGSCLLGNPAVDPPTSKGRFSGIPTGLMVAGFLSNVAMMPLDERVSSRLKDSHSVAHFRFVDDHAILARDFDELIQWIEAYEDDLKELAIGPAIAREKFDPPDLVKVLDDPHDTKIRTQVQLEAKLDGSRPAKLMTKTLALVSDLAGMDFDVLAEPVRDQRLSEIEWLLSADLPDHEIRGDTRVAFAAGRLAALVPIAFSPPFPLLEASRELFEIQAQLSRKGEIPEDQISYLETRREVVKERLSHERRLDLKRRRERVARYFKLIFHAFCDHPEKSRMFVRLFDYCRTTGHDGVNSILSWLVEREIDNHNKSFHYFGALALQTLARHITTAASDLNNDEILARQRFAARRFLVSVSKSQAVSSLLQIISSEREQHHCDIAARSTLLAAVAAATESVGLRHKGKIIHRRVEKLRLALGAPLIMASSAEWEAVTGSGLGVWTHLLDRWSAPGSSIGPIWPVTASTHDPSVHLDWVSLRKVPEKLPPAAVSFLAAPGASVLKRSDSGWLLDATDSEESIYGGRFRTGQAGVRLRSYLRERRQRPDKVSLLEWVKQLKSVSVYDPRRSEWTALELVRQLLMKVRRFPEGKLEDLDHLHPANVLLPRKWLEPTPPAELHQEKWTWESWKHVVRTSPDALSLVRRRIIDFRRSPALATDGPEQHWDARLRGCGLLLLGLADLDFRLPSLWNVRGLERDFAGFAKSQLEQLALSSRSLAIIEAALLPRSVETRFMMLFSWAFFGTKRPDVINDTTTDPPLIRDIEDLLGMVESSQTVLERNQISVLHHAPRQLIPMNVIQMVSSAIELPPQEVDQ